MSEAITRTFIANLVAAMEAGDWNDAKLSVAAGLNRRAVTDLRDGKVASPKLSTVFALAEALGQDPGAMMGLDAPSGDPPSPPLHGGLAAYLSGFSPEEQAQLLEALRLLPGRSPE